MIIISALVLARSLMVSGLPTKRPAKMLAGRFDYRE